MLCLRLKITGVGVPEGSSGSSNPGGRGTVTTGHLLGPSHGSGLPAGCLVEFSWVWTLCDSSPGRRTGTPVEGGLAPCHVLESSLCVWTVVPRCRDRSACEDLPTDWAWHLREREEHASAACFPDLARCCSSRLMCTHGKHTQALPRRFTEARAPGLSSKINQWPFIDCLPCPGHAVNCCEGHRGTLLNPALEGLGIHSHT